jgi:hypothetical protein
MGRNSEWQLSHNLRYLIELLFFFFRPLGQKKLPVVISGENIPRTTGNKNGNSFYGDWIL